jgi:hypothetical protein
VVLICMQNRTLSPYFSEEGFPTRTVAVDGEDAVHEQLAAAGSDGADDEWRGDDAWERRRRLVNARCKDAGAQDAKAHLRPCKGHTAPLRV